MCYDNKKKITRWLNHFPRAGGVIGADNEVKLACGFVQLCDGQYVEPTELKKINDAICQERQTRIQNLIPLPELADKQCRKFVEYARDKYKDISKQNEGNKEVWYKTIGPKLGAALLSGAKAFFTNLSHPKRWPLALVSAAAGFLTHKSEDKTATGSQSHLDDFTGTKFSVPSPSSSVDLPKPQASLSKKQATSSTSAPIPTPPSPPPPYSEKPKNH